ncbi:uncharacterized protein MEPE_02898 [Melanopsichium pennsylvanicum]|uniref:Ima1 N-terminal domain-containing protein n=2 Tax=Melanopsichium pennsylvanicum TaxID=63383 RepID=A0AAJ4XL65_9BASI|nr:conserved hypothetical protein [Melanopsichium pennsylvanicum 4]SNX84190.1 uncharacterized protein MEPE_02898 [Melanopsichium pennsylvanicum]
MWRLLSRSSRGVSGYPQRECFFCCITSLILPPYKPGSSSAPGPVSFGDGLSVHSSDVATSSTTTISTGTPTNWFCANCHCQNVSTRDGTPVEQYTRPMWDEDWNRNRSDLLRHTRPQVLPAKAIAMSSPIHRTSFATNANLDEESFNFCHTCQTNQVLSLNMLSDYLPSEDDSEYQQKLTQLSQYQASIAARYPAVCADCQPKVQQRICERDQFARSWSLGRWLDLKKKASNADLHSANERAKLDSAGKPAQRASLPAPQSAANRSLWSKSVRLLSKALTIESGSTSSKLIFALVNMSIFGLYLITWLWPLTAISTLQRASKRIETEPMPLLTISILTLTFSCLPKLFVECYRMEPLKRSIESARARRIRVEAQGICLWRATQLVILVLRICTLLAVVIASATPEWFRVVLDWLEACTDTSSIRLLRLAALTMLMSEISLMALAGSRLRVQTASPLQLVSKPSLSNSRHVKSTDVAADPLLTSLSLDDQPTRATFAFGQMGGLHDSMTDSIMDDSTWIPSIQHDMDGDAVMEDAAHYAARVSTCSDDEDWEHGSGRICAPPSASNWAASWGKGAPLQKRASAIPATMMKSASIGNGVTQASSRYKDFELGPQRFWEPQKPTGLEDVFVRAVSLDERPQSDLEPNSGARSGGWSKWFGFT